MPEPSILVTGAAGGLGAATTAMFARHGWQVFAADLRAPEATSDRVHPSTVDVTNPDSVAAMAERVAAQAPNGLRAVVNFAGIMLVGPLVEVAEEELRRVLDVNVMGTFRVNRAVFEQVLLGNGRIVNISSETGWQHALMLNGPYAMSKHAVEAYSDALRRELMFLDVPVVVIRPGPFRTGMVAGIAQAFDRASASSVHFPWLVRKVGRMAVREEHHAHEPSELAELVYHAATVRRPRPFYRIGTDPRRALLHMLPVRVADAALRRSLGRGRP